MVNCAGNMQQIGTALSLYAEDYDEAFPNRLTGWPKSATNWNQQEAYTWRAAIIPYLKSGKPFLCLSNPMNQRPTGCTVDVCGATSYPDGFFVSYACNFIPGTVGSGSPRGFCGDKNALPQKLSGVVSSSQTISIVEDESTWSEFDVLKPSFSNLLFTGHMGGGNYLFVDGHVAAMTPADTLHDFNHWTVDSRPFTDQEQLAADGVLGIAH